MDKYFEFFDEYVSGFDVSEPHIWRKHEHTLRVAKNCESIARDLGFTSRDTETAVLVGLFHDIGRFQQWRDYGSFSDFETVDHAELGIKIIEENGILAEYPDFCLIKKSIHCHNKYSIDSDITDDRELIFCKLIRDADKLDIVREILASDVKLPRLTEHERYGSEALDEIAAGKLVDRKHHSNEPDYVLASLAMFNDIYFDYTWRCIREEFLIEKMIERYIESSPSQKATFIQLEKALKTKQND